MADPSTRVAQPLRPHVHLLSHHRYAYTAQLNLEQVFRYLIEAPSVVKQVAPMYWHYALAPQDGTVWLEWLPPDKFDAYPSDGYVWADTEHHYRHDYGGYTIEVRTHQIGYRPGQDHVAQHSRTRYHFLSKNPSVNAPPPDPSLWIVHYHPSDPSHFHNVAQLPVMPHISQIISQRRWLESLGRLEGREFMLHDRENWPTVNLPGPANMHAGVYSANQAAGMPMAPNRYPPNQFPGNVPPNKRARTQGPGAQPAPVPHEAPQIDSTIEDEENTSYGDYFDHLSQRDISIARYTQHHRWMEEVFSSPYATNQIVPPDLGLGLVGELASLTEGILDPPSLELVDREQNRSIKAEEVRPFTNLKEEQLSEFNKRVDSFLEEGRAELERMKADHAKKMQSWRNVSLLADAEKKLRYATWAGHENAVPVFRLEQPAQGKGDNPTETVEDVVQGVEKLLGLKIEAYGDSVLVSRGGLRERKSPGPVPDDELNRSNEGADGATGGARTTQDLQAASAAAGSRPPGTHSQVPPAGASSNAPSASAVPAAPTQVNAQTGLPSQTNLPGGQSAVDDITDMDIPELDDIDMSMDIGDSDLQFDTSLQPASTAHTGNTSSTGAQLNPSQPQAQPPNQSAATAGTNAAMNSNVAASDVTGTANGSGGADLVNDSTFDDLADDGLIDFDGGMDDSAFGDAMHGMDEGN